MKKPCSSGRWVLALILFTILALSFSVTSASLNVCKIGCDFSSIGEAIDNSSSGDRIEVQNGNYSENLRIDHDLTIAGTNFRWVTITPSNSDTPAITVGPSSVTVEINNLSVAGGDSRAETGVTVTGDSQLTLRNTRVNNFQQGLSIRDSSNLKIRESKIENSDVGVAGFDNSEITITGTSISTSTRGIAVNGSAAVTMVDAEVSNCSRSGLRIKETAKVNVISSNIINNQAPGIVVKEFSRLNMKETKVSGNESGGILLANSAVANLTNNQITYNKKKNVLVISKECGFSGHSHQFFGEINGAGNVIKPVNSSTVCPSKFSGITSTEGGSYSYPLKPSTYTFIGLITVASLYFLLSS